MSKLGTESEIREAVRNTPVPLQRGAAVDGDVFIKDHARIEHPLTGEVRQLPRDHRGRVKVWHFFEKKFIWRQPVDVLEILANQQGQFDEPAPDEDAPKGKK